MAEKSALMIHFDRLAAADFLTREEKGELFEAMVAYSRDGVIVEFENRAVEVIFHSIKCALDDDAVRYEEKRQQNSENGKKGGAPKGNQNARKQTKQAGACFDEEKTSENKQALENEQKNKQNKQALENGQKNNQNKPNTNTYTNSNSNSFLGDTDVSLSTGVDAPAESAPGKVTAKQVVDLFNTICVSYPRVTVLSEKRRKAINARLKSMGYSLDAFRVLFEKAEMSDFLKGRNNKDWRATFDWLIKDGNMAKVLDGNYDNRPAGGYVCGNGQTVPGAFAGMAEWAAKYDDNSENPIGILSG